VRRAFVVLVWFRITLTFVFVKVIPKILLVPFFSGHGRQLYLNNYNYNSAIYIAQIRTQQQMVSVQTERLSANSA